MVGVISSSPSCLSLPILSVLVWEPVLARGVCAWCVACDKHVYMHRRPPACALFCLLPSHGVTSLRKEEEEERKEKEGRKENEASMWLHIIY